MHLFVILHNCCLLRIKKMRQCFFVVVFFPLLSAIIHSYVIHQLASLFIFAHTEKKGNGMWRPFSEEGSRVRS